RPEVDAPGQTLRERRDEEDEVVHRLRRLADAQARTPAIERLECATQLGFELRQRLRPLAVPRMPGVGLGAALVLQLAERTRGGRERVPRADGVQRTEPIGLHLETAILDRQ